MTIAIWQSYSCNNSSSYRLIARFADAATARQVATELTGFFAAHATEIDQRERYGREPSLAQRALGERYGFTWANVLIWGDEGLSGDEPDVSVEGDLLLLYHHYCGGFGDVPAFLAARGGTVSAQYRTDLEVSLLFRSMPGVNPQLDAEIATVFEALDEEEDDGEPRWLEPVPVPWPHERDSYGHVAAFRDAGTVGLHLAIHPLDLELAKKWLLDRGVEGASIQIGEAGDERVFRAIRRARCRSCDGPVEYLDPRLHDIETPQLVCRPCGGFYELQTFVEAT
jgi:hypothetical protein